MSNQTYWETLVTAQIDGPTLTAAAAATCLQPAMKVTLPAGPSFWSIGKKLKIVASGRISNAVTTPGTARFDIRFTDSAATTVVVMDSLAMNLNIVAKTNVGWYLELDATCRAIGATANLMWQGTWRSEAVIASPLPTVGGSGEFLLPYNSAPAVGNNFDATKTNIVDMFFTQTVATGSMTLHQYELTVTD